MKRRLLVTIAGVGFLVAGCTSDPDAVSTSSVDRPVTRPSLPTVAPTVNGGVDLDPYLAKPCALLTADQRAAAGGLRQTFQGGDAGGGHCTWEAPGTLASVITYATGDPLADVYARRNDRYHTYFEAFVINGLPAVRTWAAPPPAGGCDVYVGTGHGRGLRVESARSTDGDKNADWCAHATALAEAMVVTAQG